MYTIIMVAALSTGADTPGIAVPGRCFGWPGSSGFSNCFAGRACSGSGNYSAFSYYGQNLGYNCQGTTPSTAADPMPGYFAPTPAAAPEKIAPPKGEALEATITVKLPAEAKLSFDGRATKQDSETRVFVTPALEAGKVSFYQLRAEMVLAGRNRIVVQQIMVRAGQETLVEVDFARAEVIVRR
jgi:uncharacterized protein (TIGR03000 family)